MSNFTYLKANWPDLYATAFEADQNVNSAPRTSCFYARRSLERAVKWFYANDSYLKQPYADNLAALIHDPTFRENMEPPRSSPSSKSAIWLSIVSMTFKQIKTGVINGIFIS